MAGIQPEATVRPAAQLAEGLKAKLRAAEARERELHQHLLFHLQEKESLQRQVAELQDVVESLSVSRGSQLFAGQSLDTSDQDTSEALENYRTGRQLVPATTSKAHASRSSSLKAIMSTAGGESSSTRSADTSADALAVDSGPAGDIRQLLLERGGHIRITELWDEYQNRFGVTRYTLKDLFAMVKSGAIQGVVHEPPAGIRLQQVLPVRQWTQQQRSSQSSPDANAVKGRPSSLELSAPIPEAPTAAADASESSGADGKATFSMTSGDTPTANDVSTADGRAVTRSGVIAPNEHLTHENASDSPSQEAEAGDVSPDRASARNATTRPTPENSTAREKRHVDWRTLKQQINLLLKEEGPLHPADFTIRFTQRYRQALYLGGVPLRYAVAAEWIRGVCFDTRSKAFNLVVRVPENFREPRPEDAPETPPEHTRAPRGVTSRDTASRRSDAEPNWQQLSTEFRWLLAEGALEPRELHAKYHKDLKKQLLLGGYGIRQAVIDGLVRGVKVERGTRRIMLA